MTMNRCTLPTKNFDTHFSPAGHGGSPYPTMDSLPEMKEAGFGRSYDGQRIGQTHMTMQCQSYPRSPSDGGQHHSPGTSSGMPSAPLSLSSLPDMQQNQMVTLSMDSLPEENQMVTSNGACYNAPAGYVPMVMMVPVGGPPRHVSDRYASNGSAASSEGVQASELPHRDNSCIIKAAAAMREAKVLKDAMPEVYED